MDSASRMFLLMKILNGQPLEETCSLKKLVKRDEAARERFVVVKEIMLRSPENLTHVASRKYARPLTEPRIPASLYSLAEYIIWEQTWRKLHT